MNAIHAGTLAPSRHLVPVDGEAAPELDHERGAVDLVVSALASSARREILETLREAALSGEGTLAISVIADRVGLDRFAASRHLAVLRRAGLVRAGRDTRGFKHELSSQRFEDLEEWLLRFLDERLGSGIGRAGEHGA